MTMPRSRAPLLLLLVALSFGACRRDPPTVVRDPTPVASVPVTSSIAPGVPADLKIVLLRTMCKGQCPAYAVVIEASGRVTFIGQAFVTTTRAEAMLTRPELLALVAAIDEARFFALADVNPNWKDCSRSRTTILMGGRSADVRDGCVGADAHDDPPGGDALRLEHLGNEIDRIVGTARWVSEGEVKRLFDEPDAASSKNTPELDYFH